MFNFRGVQSAFPTLDGVAGRRRKSKRGAMGTVIEEEEAGGRREARLGQ